MKLALDTKSKGDIAEQAATLHAMKLGWNVLKPIGDRLPYDLVFEIQSVFVKIQVKAAWYDQKSANFVIDNRRTKTNRRKMLRSLYCEEDFDFALAYIGELDLFYVFPVDVFTSYGCEIHLVEAGKRQRKPRSFDFRNSWELISQWAAQGETSV